MSYTRALLLLLALSILIDMSFFVNSYEIQLFSDSLYFLPHGIGQLIIALLTQAALLGALIYSRTTSRGWKFQNESKSSFLFLGLGFLGGVTLLIGPEALINFDASRRQILNYENPYIPRLLIAFLPFFLFFILHLRKIHLWTLLIPLFFVYFQFGSRTQLAFLALAALHQILRGNKKGLLLMIFAILPVVFVLLGFQRSGDGNALSLNVFSQAFQSGHFSLVDVLALALNDGFSAGLGLKYYLAALAGPFRELLGFDDIRSASEIFTAAYDPDRLIGTLSLIAVGAFAEELIIVGGKSGVLITVAVIFTLARIRHLLIRVVGIVYPATTVIDIIFGMYFVLYLRSDFWITTVYLWLHLPFWAFFFIWARRQMRQRRVGTVLKTIEKVT